MGTANEMAAREQQAAEMLEEMIKATHQLDEILQQMCAADPLSSKANDPSGSDSGSDTEFEDCISAAIEENGHVTADEYLQAVRNSFRGSKDGRIELSRSVVNTRSLSASLTDVSGDLKVRFASCTRDTAFVFQTVKSAASATSSGYDGASAASPPLESNVSYSYFLSRLRQEIVDCDHIAPVERADEAAQLMFLLLEEQQRRLLGAISSQFPYQRDSVYWAQGNRVCEMSVQETQQDQQWGLLVQSNVRSQLRPRVGELAAGASVKQDPSLSSCTCCRLFLPKVNYLRSSASKSAFQASIAVELAFNDIDNQELGAEDEQNNRKGDGAVQTDGQPTSNQFGERTSSFTAELPELLTVSIWGRHDEDPLLDDKSSEDETKRTNIFRKVRIETPFPRNRVVQAACSRFHTLFLNDMGLVFAYGHALDGALGLGSEVRGYVAQPTLVDFFFDNLIVVQSISCGGDQLVGAHTAAVSQDGGLFTWGVGIALGKGTLRSASTPQRVELPPADATPEAVVTAHSVSCGSGFCVALSRDGHAFSWGKWNDGRLGLGRIPIIARTSRRHGGGAVRKQFQSFQLSPRRIETLQSKRTMFPGINAGGRTNHEALFSSVKCGDAHCVGLTMTGELVTWGRGNSGQQGRGDASDTLSPTPVFTGNGEKRWRDVAAGENWSMALSTSGQVWTWGACGGAVLGHGLYGSQKNALLAETILQRHQRLLSQRKRSSTGYPTLPSLRWMTPQMIPCFSSPDVCISRISAGTQHAAAISDTGDLYMWGEGCVGDGLTLSSLPKLMNSGQSVEDAELSDQPAADIGTYSVEHVVCGGRQTLTFTSGSFLARSMNKLYHESIAHGKLAEAAAIAGADLVLIVSGQRLLAHKLLLAQRSPVLRELILEEEQHQKSRFARSQDDEHSAVSSNEPMELLLPRLRVDVARAVVEFIYTDSFTVEVSKSSYYLVSDVLRAAKLYKLSSLAHLCRERLFSESPSSILPDQLDEIAEEDEFSDTHSEDDVGDGDTASEAPRTLNDDMKFAMNDKIWVDTLLVAEGRELPVHRCMVVARSEYFRAVLAFHRSAGQLADDTSREMTTLNVEDSYAGLVRVLRFIYYDQVVLPLPRQKIDKGLARGSEEQDDAEEASDQLLEDLVAADKYGLERMKRLCEHAICVTVANCLEVLAVAELVHASHLKQVAMRFVQTHLADVTNRQEEFHRFQADFPLLLEELYTSLRDANRDEFLLREWHKEVSTSLAADREEQELEWGKKSAEARFPWVPLSLTVAFGTMYLSLMHAQEHEFSAVPATNLVAIAAIGGAILLGYL